MELASGSDIPLSVSCCFGPPCGGSANRNSDHTTKSNEYVALPNGYLDSDYSFRLLHDGTSQNQSRSRGSVIDRVGLASMGADGHQHCFPCRNSFVVKFQEGRGASGGHGC